jgi:hypothetical protein
MRGGRGRLGRPALVVRERAGPAELAVFRWIGSAGPGRHSPRRGIQMAMIGGRLSATDGGTCLPAKDRVRDIIG